MRYLKKFAAFITALILILPCFIFPASAEGEDWLFIDGENIHRKVNMAVIYTGRETTKQNDRGYNVVIDSDNKVIDIIEPGDAKGNDLAIPENGAVISASGTKIQWLKDNVRVGDSIYYDGYTRRLFVKDSNGNANVYINLQFAVNPHAEGFAIAEENDEGRSDYTYSIVTDAEGTIISKGRETNVPEGGNIIYALTPQARNLLIANAIIGGKCLVTENIATIVYDKSCLAKSLELIMENASAKIEAAKAEFNYVNYADLDSLLAEIIQLTEEDLTYYNVAEMLHKYEIRISELSSETLISELRGAFHTPNETSSTEVRATVLSAKAAGLNTIILRIPNGYGTYIPLPDEDRFAQSSSYKGFDLLQSYIEICKNENIALTLCIDVYYNKSASVANPDWLSASNGSEKGLSNKYFSPASSDFKNYFLNYVNYIVSNYDIDSLMFDYLRYPKFTENSDLGYDYATMELFAIENNLNVSDVTELKTLLFDSTLWSAWTEFRKGLVDSMAREISDTVKKVREDITMTVVAGRDTVDYFYMQDALQWVQDKVFDGVTVAFYESDPDELDHPGENAYYGGIIADKGQTYSAYTGEGAYFFVGLESSADIDQLALAAGIEDARNLGSDGFVFSNLEDFINQNYSDILSDGALRGTTVSPFADTAASMKKVLEFSKIKIHDLVLANGGCTDEVYLSAIDYIDKAIAQLEKGALPHDAASLLESNMAVLFADSPAKASVLKEFKDITKLALLSKAPMANEEPGDEPVEDPSVPDTDVDESIDGETSQEPDDGSQGVEGDTSSEGSVGGADDENVSTDTRPKFSINLGNLLIYGFVGATAVAVIVAIVIGIRRKKDVPKNHHMPKGSADGYGKEKDK